MSDASGSSEMGDQGADETSAQDADTATTSDGTVDWKAEAEKWKALSQKTEKDAKRTAGELKRLQAASMSDQEKVVAEAEAKGRAQALADMAQRLVDAEVRASAAGRGIDADALLDGLDRSRFVTDDGEPDREAIEQFLDRLAPKQQAKRLDLGQGARDGAATGPDMNSLLRRAAGRS